MKTGQKADRPRRDAPEVLQGINRVLREGAVRKSLRLSHELTQRKAPSARSIRR